MNCRNCNHPFPEEGTLFCPNCGRRNEVQAAGHICSVCGKDAGDDDRFCAFCGGEIKSGGVNNVQSQAAGKAVEKGKLGRSYVFTVLSAIVAFIIRITCQDEQRLYLLFG